MTVIRRSTMQPVLGEPENPLTPEQLESYRSPLLNPRNAEMEKIADRNAARTEREPTEAHDSAVRDFDVQYRDVTSNPALLREVTLARDGVIERAMRTGEKVDWNTELPKIGEFVRQKAGLPTGAERDHFDWIDDARASRGQRSR